MANILIVDQDSTTTTLLRPYLEGAGFQVSTADDGKTALNILWERKPDLLVINPNLPDCDAINLIQLTCSDLWGLTDLPIIIISGQVSDKDLILWLDYGVDDIIKKPVNPRIFVARVRALFRRCGSKGTPAPHIMRAGDLTLNTECRETIVAGRHVDLTPAEFEVLKVLMENTSCTVKRGNLIQQALGRSKEGAGRALDTHIKNLRRKIGSDPSKTPRIKTVHRVGYKLVVEE